MDMAEINRRVETKWPGYSISGNGEVAVVRTCSKTVVMCESPLLATSVREEKCCEKCNHFVDTWRGWHFISYKADRPKQAAYITCGYRERGDDE